MEAARAALETALSTENVEELRRSAEASWRNEQDTERLRTKAVRVCLEALAFAQYTQSKAELRAVGLEAVRTAGRDTLCAMAVQAAAREGVDVNTRAAGEKRWLWVAALGGLVKTLRALVEAGADVAHDNNYGYTALWAAAKGGHVEAIEALVEAGAEVNHASSYGSTALYVAACMGHVGAIHALVKAGADPNRADNDGRMPLAVTRALNHEAAAQALVQAGATG
jgi:hypothetical protein